MGSRSGTQSASPASSAVEDVGDDEGAGGGGAGVAARARPGSTGDPQRGQSPATVTDDGDRKRSQAVHQGTPPFQQGRPPDEPARSAVSAADSQLDRGGPEI